MGAVPIFVQLLMLVVHTKKVLIFPYQLFQLLLAMFKHVNPPNLIDTAVKNRPCMQCPRTQGSND
jgi:hypothetical protein